MSVSEYGKDLASERHLPLVISAYLVLSFLSEMEELSFSEVRPRLLFLAVGRAPKALQASCNKHFQVCKTKFTMNWIELDCLP